MRRIANKMKTFEKKLLEKFDTLDALLAVSLKETYKIAGNNKEHVAHCMEETCLLQQNSIDAVNHTHITKTTSR